MNIACAILEGSYFLDKNRIRQEHPDTAESAYATLSY